MRQSSAVFALVLCACADAKTDATCAELAQLIATDDGKELPAYLDKAALTACPELIPEASKCWVNGDGTTCRHGLHYGPNMGGASDGQCVVFDIDIDRAAPCETNGGGMEDNIVDGEAARAERKRLADNIDAILAEDAAKKAALEEHKQRVAAENALPLRKLTAEDDYHIGVVTKP
jgi:hypothetical protein